jgi:uncharacterized repeat protein (TIGR01451 family)
VAAAPTASSTSGGGAGTGGGGGTTQPDIQLTGSASTDHPAPGATYSYTFHVKNSGTATSPGVSFQGVLPQELPSAALQGVTNSDGSACTTVMDYAGTNQVFIACGLGDMVVGAQKTITIVVSAPLTLGTFTTWVTAYPSDVLTNPLADKNLGDNAKGITVTVR